MTDERPIDLYFGSCLNALDDEDIAFEQERQRQIDEQDVAIEQIQEIPQC